MTELIDNPPPLPRPYEKEVFATSANTSSVRKGYGMGGYVKHPNLYTADQYRAGEAAAFARGVAAGRNAGLEEGRREILGCMTDDKKVASALRLAAGLLKDLQQ